MLVISGLTWDLQHCRLHTLSRAELEQYRTGRDGRHEPGRHQHLHHERSAGQPDGQPAMPGKEGTKRGHGKGSLGIGSADVEMTSRIFWIYRLGLAHRDELLVETLRHGEAQRCEVPAHHFTKARSEESRVGKECV